VQVDMPRNASLAWVKDHFAASDDVAVTGRWGHLTAVPTIAPQQLSDGTCVFLEGEECTIHKVAPFGCRCFSMCERGDGSDEDAKKALHSLSCCADNIDYRVTHSWLKEEGKVVMPLEQRTDMLGDYLTGEAYHDED
jgi:hypothetical protein